MPSRDQATAAARRLAAHRVVQIVRNGLIAIRDSFIPTRSQQHGALLALTLFLLGLIVMLIRQVVR